MFRTEYPKPQFERKNWRCLNGKWQFEIDNDKRGDAAQYPLPDKTLSGHIEVPFCPQSKLSGIGHTDFILCEWYKRKFTIEEADLVGRVFLHFGACDFITTVFVNGHKVGEHIGGYVSFKFEITDFLTVGENDITVRVLDDERNTEIPSGKQSWRQESYGCVYTRTTGIWQTVWLEFTPKSYVETVRYVVDAAHATLTVQAETVGDGTLSVESFFDGVPTGSAVATTENGKASLTVSLSERHLWDIGQGNLYDLKLTFGDDEVRSYFGLRDIGFEDGKFMLNGRVVFQRLVLDQGFYPDGIYTAPSDDALQNDILLSQNAGFNGARLHEKVFEERFLYHADRLGYIVWGEYADWGVEPCEQEIRYIESEWEQEVARDFNHPAIIGWCPHNEREDIRYQESVRRLYRLAKRLDPTRPCIDTSGYVHVNTDIFDEHNYDQNPETFRKRYQDMLQNPALIADAIDPSRKWDSEHEPFFVSEFGGILWKNENEENGWGYGNAPQNSEEYFARFKGLCDALLDCPKCFGFCYTQLTDVEQEQNGVYRYDRSEKYDVAKIRPYITRKAIIEE